MQLAGPGKHAHQQQQQQQQHEPTRLPTPRPLLPSLQLAASIITLVWGFFSRSFIMQIKLEWVAHVQSIPYKSYRRVYWL